MSETKDEQIQLIRGVGVMPRPPASPPRPDRPMTDPKCPIHGTYTSSTALMGFCTCPPAPPIPDIGALLANYRRLLTEDAVDYDGYGEYLAVVKEAESRILSAFNSLRSERDAMKRKVEDFVDPRLFAELRRLRESSLSKEEALALLGWSPQHLGYEELRRRHKEATAHLHRIAESP